MESDLGPGNSWKVMANRQNEFLDPCTCFQPLHTLSLSTSICRFV